MNSKFKTFENNSFNSSCSPENPWCGQFGGRQIFEVIYLIFVSVFGSVGNFLVISSIIYKKRLYKHGNIFIVNLAMADLIVTGIHIPTVIANVFRGDNALPNTMCMVIGYLVTITCVCSVCNLTFIAVNRYWAVVYSETYDKMFSKRNTYFMVVFIWLWSNLLVSPTLYGWSGLGYDVKMMQCAWNDCKSLEYNIILMTAAIFIPLVIITYCYCKLFRNVRKRGTNARRLTSNSGKHNGGQKILQREINLLKTLATTVVIFMICWVPYGFCILFFTGHTPADIKKVVGWLGLSNSAVNFVIYGVMNRVFRKGYKDFLFYFCCCKACKKQPLGAHRIQGLSAKATSRAKTLKKNSLFNAKSLTSMSSPSFTPKQKENNKIYIKTSKITSLPTNSHLKRKK